MDFKNLAEWVEERLCGECKRGYTCEHYECDQAKQIAGMLRKMTPFRGRDSEGKEVSGWLVPE
jgi:hypothetical protein